MSVADVFISDLEASDLKASEIKGMLHHPMQSIRSIPGSNKMDIRSVAFVNPQFGKRNNVEIPAMDIVPQEMFLEFTVSAASDLVTPDPFWVPTPTWISAQGIDLNYKGSSCYNMTSAECLMNTILDQRDNVFQSRQRLLAFNQPVDAAAVSSKLYLPLNTLCSQVLGKVGPLASYPANSWTVDVALKNSQNLINNGAAAANVQSATITSLNLVIIGPRAPPEEVDDARVALAGAGITWNYLDGQYFSTEMPDNNGSTALYPLEFTSLVGAISCARILIRNKALLETANNQIVNPVAYQAYYGVNDTISVGKTSAPYEVWGQDTSLPIIYSLLSANSTMAPSRYLSLNGTTSLSVGGVDTGLINVNFAESATDMLYGTSSGSYPVKNDLAIVLNISTDTVQDNVIDTVVYVHKRGLITAGSLDRNLSA